MDTMVRTSSEQLRWTDMMSIFDKLGSKGNSAICKHAVTVPLQWCRHTPPTYAYYVLFATVISVADLVENRYSY
jgi:hypothetical protein